MQNLNKIYDAGDCVVPKPGRYAVLIEAHGLQHRILEKKIFQGRGCNYLPVFLLRHRRIKLMDFSVHTANGEVIFKYTKMPLEDRLKKVDYNRWLGEIHYRGEFVDYFWLVRV